MESNTAGNKLLLSSLFLLLFLGLGDCVSTYLCLSVSSPDYYVSEVNPLSAWAFDLVGIVPGLVILSAPKIAGLAVLYKLAMSRGNTYWPITGGLILSVVLVFVANINNWYILHVLTQKG